MIYLKEGQIPLNFAYNDEIIQEGNSKYQLSFKFPTNNPLWEELVEETLLLADDLHGEQEFIIFEVEKHHAYITVYANQVATLLNNYSITELSVNNASGDRVMRSLVSSIIREHKFTFSSNIANTHSLNLKNVTVANALFKDKHSIIGQWGGDLIRDKYDIRLLSNGGTNKEALFMYKKNLKSYQQKKSIKDLRTRIHFTKTINSQKEGEKDKVIAVTVDSPLISKYKNIYEGNLDVSDQDVTDEATLRKYGEQYFKTTLCDVIEENIEISVLGTPDEPVQIFDTVTIFYEKYNLDVKKKITKYTYAPMGRKLKTIGFGKIQSNLGTTLATMVDNAIEEKAETMLDAFKLQKNLAQLLKLDRKGIEDKLVELEEKSKGALEVKKALFEADGTIPDVVKAKILDAVEGDIGRLKTIITEAELIKAIQAKLNFAEIKNALIDKAFINQIISDEKFTQQFEEGQVTTQNIFTKLKDSIKSNISKEFVTKDGVRKLVNDLTIDADGIRQITQQESSKVFETKKSQLQGINSYIHKKYSDYPDGRNMSDNSNLKYIGIYTGNKQQAPTNASEYSWTKIRGEDGAKGRDGVDGKSINRNYIIDSDKLTNINSGGTNWEKTVENGTLVFTKVRATESTGIWTQIMPILKDNFQNEVLTWSVDVKASKNISFNNVGQETNGFKGRVDITTQWQRISHTFTNRYTQHYAFVFYQMIGTCSPGDKVYVRLPKLEKGNVATEWSPAYEDLRGRDGVSNYIHRKYSDSSNGANMDDNSNRKYIGIYTGTSPTPPTTASSYLWSKIKGEDGANGVPGAKGADGRTPYFHTAYSNSPTGDRDFSTINSNDKLYIGTYSDFEVADSNDYRRYKWVKIKGEDGRNGVSSYIYRKYSDNANGSPMSDNSNLKYIGIYTGTSATAPTTPTAYTWSKIKGEDGQQGVPGARGADGKTSYLHTAYANSATGDRDFSTTNSNGKEYIGTYTDFEINDSNDYRRYKWVKIKGENGRDGNNGRDGRDGNVELNLLNGTKEFVKSQFASPDNFQKNLVWIDEIERYEDFAVKSTIYQFNGLWQNVKVEKGKTYEFGFFAKGSRDTDRILFSPGWASSSAKQPLAQYNINSIPFKLTTAWKFYSFRFTVTQTGWSQCRVEKNEVNNGIKFSLCGLYLKELKNDQSSPLGWSPSIEDLQGHSLTANLWFSGNYINNVTSNVRLNLVVYYDGKEIRDFNANIKYVGGGINDWRTQENVRVLRDNTVDYGFWSNSEKNGTPLFALAIVSYKGLQIISDARLDNVPNVEDIKETIKKFKTFESTLDSFKSVIGEIKSKEIKTIINTPNLCTEDFSNNKSKRGNDLYFNVSPSLKANTKYTVIVDVSLEKVEVHQKTKVYGAKSGGGEQWLKSGRNVWVVDYATEQTRVNIYPLGEFSKVFNVEIYEGDYREFIEQNNRFISMDTAKREQSGFYSYKINHNINNGKGKYFLVKFDLASLPADKWFASGDNGTLALYSFGAKQFTEELKLKDNEYIFKAHLDDTFYIFHSTNSLNLINVRLYEVRFGVTLATQNSLIDISSMIDQSKEAVTLSARKEIEGKLTNYPTNAYLLNNFANKQELENLVSKSELKVLSDRIESSVNTGNFGTTLSQNAYYVRVAWNSISNYVQFENGGLNFYEGSTTQNNLRARIDDGNYTFWRDGYNLGNMGTGYYKLDNQKKGIQFHLEYDGWFMGWAYKQKRTDDFYTWKWYYTSGSVGDTYADTLNAGCNTNFRWNEIWYFKTRTSWFNIMDGLNGTISVVSNIENTGDGGIRWWTRNLTFKNGILIGG